MAEWLSGWCILSLLILPLLFLLLLFMLFSRFRSGALLQEALLAWRGVAYGCNGLRVRHGDVGVAASFEGMPPFARLRRNVHNSVRLRLRWQLHSLRWRISVREHGRILRKRISVREHGPSRRRRISVRERQGARISVREPSRRIRRLGPDRLGTGWHGLGGTDWWLPTSAYPCPSPQ